MRHRVRRLAREDREGRCASSDGVELLTCEEPGSNGCMSVDGCNELDKHDSCGPIGVVLEELGPRGLKRIRGLPLEDEDEQNQGSGPVQVVARALGACL